MLLLLMWSWRASSEVVWWEREREREGGKKEKSKQIKVQSWKLKEQGGLMKGERSSCKCVLEHWIGRKGPQGGRWGTSIIVHPRLSLSLSLSLTLIVRNVAFHRHFFLSSYLWPLPLTLTTCNHPPPQISFPFLYHSF